MHKRSSWQISCIALLVASVAFSETNAGAEVSVQSDISRILVACINNSISRKDLVKYSDLSFRCVGEPARELYDAVGHLGVSTQEGKGANNESARYRVFGRATQCFDLYQSAAGASMSYFQCKWVSPSLT
jgi:hypothetical protein